jgi:uncharacterized oligopeptide transporter (OPT) family protein
MPVTAGFMGTILTLEYVISSDDNGPRSTSRLIRTLHHQPRQFFVSTVGHGTISLGIETPSELLSIHDDREARKPHTGDAGWQSRMTMILQGAAASRLIVRSLASSSNATATREMLTISYQTTLMYFVPITRALPIFGQVAAECWLWTLDTSPGFVSQRIITGPVIPLHMNAGSVLGWGILLSMSKRRGWVPGRVDDWETQARGWIIWISLAVLMADYFVKLS